MKLSNAIEQVLIRNGYVLNELTDCYEKGNNGLQYAGKEASLIVWDISGIHHVVATFFVIKSDEHHLAILKACDCIPEHVSILSPKQEYNARIDAENKLYHNEQAI